MREGESLGSLRNIGECRAKARKAFLPVTLLADDFDDSNDLASRGSVRCPVPVRVSVLVRSVPCERGREFREFKEYRGV